MLKQIVAAAVAASVTFGCGGDSDGSGDGGAEGKLGSSAYVVVTSGDLQRSEALLKGSGSIAFKDPIGEIGAKKKALFNSEEDGATPGQGSANFLGLVLTKASVTGAAIGDAKFVEE